MVAVLAGLAGRLEAGHYHVLWRRRVAIRYYFAWEAARTGRAEEAGALVVLVASASYYHYIHPDPAAAVEAFGRSYFRLPIHSVVLGPGSHCRIARTVLHIHSRHTGHYTVDCRRRLAGGLVAEEVPDYSIVVAVVASNCGAVRTPWYSCNDAALRA